MFNLKTQVLFKVVLLGLLVLLSSCAGKKLFVSNADSLLKYQVVKRLPLYSDQKDKLDKDIKAFLNKKKQDTPDLLSVIDEIQMDEEQKFKNQYHKIAAFYDNVSLDFSALLSRYMVLLDSKQQKDFFKTLDDENRDLARKDSDERMEKIRERFKTFMGTINEKQKQLLVDMKDEFEENNFAKLDRRKKLHQKFREIFNGHLSPDSGRKQFYEAFEDYQKNAHNHDKNKIVLKKILATLSPQQKEFFRTRVAEVKEILKLYLEQDY